MLTVACVFKTGGDFTPDYVRRLVVGVRRSLTVSHQFMVLTDEQEIEADIFDVRPLIHGWPGWWSKMELFTLPGPVLALDLDTVIVGSLDGLAREVEALGNRMMLLQSWRQPTMGSAIMGWSGDVSGIWRTFLGNVAQQGGARAFSGNRLILPARQYRGDQDWIDEHLRQRKAEVVSVQSLISGVYSYKHHVVRMGLPTDARIICFHGHPRPHEVKPRPEWLGRYWQ